MKKKEPVITYGIYLYNTRTKKILVCHATHSSWKAWTIPKGLKNPGENAFTSASRELKEETGIDMAELQILNTTALAPVKYEKQNKILEALILIWKIFSFAAALW
jgi:ADP-ribose pyrophosphatase YjhB (NUDIX family)